MAGGEYAPSDAEADLLLPPPAGSLVEEPSSRPRPADTLGLAYAIFFTLGAGFLLPWNAFITAVDYFSYLYPGAPVDRVFSVAYMLACFLPLVLIVLCFPKSSALARINTGLSLFTVVLLVVPVMDAAYVKGVPRLYGAFDVTVAATVLCGVADALVQGGVIGFAGELPESYMQAVVAGTAASGLRGDLTCLRRCRPGGSASASSRPASAMAPPSPNQGRARRIHSRGTGGRI